MVRAIRWFRTEWLTGGLHLVIVAIAVETESADAWPYALAAMAVVSFFAWMGNYRRYRQVHDLPTSKVASAAQGYVELFGRSKAIPDSPVMAPLSSMPCCWYRYTIERKGSDNKWKHEESGESISHFLLVDDTGECVISPDGAEVLYARKGSWIQGDRRLTEWLLLPEGQLYALGEFTTTGGAHLALEEGKDVSHLLGNWKQDQARLLERFDMDRDGKLDLKEWELARLEAQREVQQRHAELRLGQAVHLMTKPADGRVFILASTLPERIGKRFALWAWAHLVFLFGAALASFVLFRP